MIIVFINFRAIDSDKSSENDFEVLEKQDSKL